MAKKPNVPCTRCGRLTWTSPSSAPPDRRICNPCRGVRRIMVEPIIWQLHRYGDTATAVLEDCARCGARPRIAGQRDGDPQQPRAISWVHRPDCPVVLASGQEP